MYGSTEELANKYKIQVTPSTSAKHNPILWHWKIKLDWLDIFKFFSEGETNYIKSLPESLGVA